MKAVRNCKKIGHYKIYLFKEVSMPQLPSGLKVGISANRVLELARQGNFQLSMGFRLEAREPKDIAPLINLIYYSDNVLDADESVPGEPYFSNLMAADVGTEKCEWSKVDQEAFIDWFHSDVVRPWLLEIYTELAELIRTVKPPLPDALRGIMH
jgi:hypothetical protein